MISYPNTNNNLPVEVKNSTPEVQTIEEHTTRINVSSFTAIIRPSVSQNTKKLAYCMFLRELVELKYRLFMPPFKDPPVLHHLHALSKFPVLQTNIYEMKVKINMSELSWHLWDSFLVHINYMYLINGQTLLCLFNHETCLQSFNTAYTMGIYNFYLLYIELFLFIICLQSFGCLLCNHILGLFEMSYFTKSLYRNKNTTNHPHPHIITSWQVYISTECLKINIFHLAVLSISGVYNSSDTGWISSALCRITKLKLK